MRDEKENKDNDSSSSSSSSGSSNSSIEGYFSPEDEDVPMKLF